MPLIDNLILVAKTRDEGNAGTDNRHNLTVTIDGVIFNLDFPFGLGEGIDRGETGVTPYAILPSPDRAPAGLEPLRELDRLDLRRNPLDDELGLPFDLEPGDGLLMLPE